MLFTDPLFLLVVLPALLALYFLALVVTPRLGGGTPRRFALANIVVAGGGALLLVAGLGDVAAAILVGAGILHLTGRGISRASHEARPGAVRASALPELLFAAAITAVIAGFVWVRLTDPDGGGADPWLPAALDGPFAARGLIAPFGITIVTCHAVSYLADIYRGDATAPRNPVHSLAYLLFFPFMVAGPIVRFRDVRAVLATRQVGMAAFAYGVRRFTIGLVKVGLVARTLAGPADLAFSLPAARLDAAHAWLGLACVTLQIYVEFSGYADMALGLGRMLGFRLPENFNRPYAARTVAEFWRRWNLSLATWLDTYLGLSVGRDGAARGARQHLRLVPLFLLIALWHGTAWGVAAWGALHGTMTMLERTRWGTRIDRLPVAARHAYLVTVVLAGWVLFRAGSLTAAGVFFQALGGFGAAAAAAGAAPLTAGVVLALGVGVLGAGPAMPTVGRWSVTVDAIATALQMIVTTAVMFVWARVLGQRRSDLALGDDTPSDDGAGPR